MVSASSPLEEFLGFLKEKTGKTIRPFDAVFDRRYAPYRHLPYPDIETDLPEADLAERTWINIILREGLNDEVRAVLFPEYFDLGNTNAGSSSARLSDLIAEINGDVGSRQGEKLLGKTKKHLQPTLNGIATTIGHDLSNTEIDYPVSSLKVVKLLYTKNLKSRLYQLIKPPHLGENPTPTPEFMEAAQDELNSDDTLVVADLISYLSLEIPDEKLKEIRKRIPLSHELLSRIAHENINLTEPIRMFCAEGGDKIARSYQELTRQVEEYQPLRLTMSPTPLNETLYTYLRTLPFQHFVGYYEKVIKGSAIEKLPNNVTEAINDFCVFLGKESSTLIYPGTPVISINGFSEFVQRHEKAFRQIVESAIGFYVRPDAVNELVNHARKILAIHVWRLRGIKDLDAVAISISECVAALCTVRHQQDVKTSYQLYVLGQKTPGKSPLRSFAKERGIEELQEQDYIPQSASQLMLLRFGRMHSYITGHGDERIDAWSEFQLVRLKKYVEIFQSYDIDAITFAVRRFNEHCERAVHALIGSHAHS